MKTMPIEKKHLIEVRAVVQRPVERALEHGPDQCRPSKSGRQTQQEGQAQALHEQHRDVAAHHGKRAMGQVDEVHQTHGHRQAHGQDEQQHAVGDTVKKYGQHGSVGVKSLAGKTLLCEGAR